MLLYRGLRLILRGAAQLYYVDIQSTGQELIPPSGPVIFAANHPNSIMDTVLLGTQTQRVISYLARSGLFHNPLVAALFHACGVIPLYRAQDDPSLLHRNQDSFRSAFDRLAQGGCIGIFPEGQNSHERAVKQLRTGTARIALGAEAAHHYQLGVKIIPVGLNFVNRDRFLSSVLVRFGEPIDASDFALAHQLDPQQAARDLTDLLQTRLRQQATHIETDLTQRLTHDIYKIYGDKLLEDLSLLHNPRDPLTLRMLDDLRTSPQARHNLDDVFWLKQRIADAISWMHHHDPPFFDHVHNQIQAYKDHLAQVRLRHDFLDRRPETTSRRREAFKFTLYALTLFPLALWGLIINALPYLLTRQFALAAPDEPLRAIRALSIGMLLYPLTWSTWLFIFHNIGANLWILIILGATFTPAGFFSLRYRRQWLRYRERILVRTLFVTNRFLILRLAAERQKILDLLDLARQRFTTATGSQAAAHFGRSDHE